jgi:uncharacterized protein YdhG (YjbR/CyaY superfamily)
VDSKKEINTIDDYVSIFSNNIKSILQELRRVIREAAPEAKEVISYKMPAYKLNGNLVFFAAYKDHIGFYPGPSAIDAFKEILTKYKISKGTIRFPLNTPLPYDLIKEIVKFRVRENSAKIK